jgi:hypothetical protein
MQVTEVQNSVQEKYACSYAKLSAKSMPICTQKHPICRYTVRVRSHMCLLLRIAHQNVNRSQNGIYAHMYICICVITRNEDILRSQSFIMKATVQIPLKQLVSENDISAWYYFPRNKIRRRCAQNAGCRGFGCRVVGVITPHCIGNFPDAGDVRMSEEISTGEDSRYSQAHVTSSYKQEDTFIHISAHYCDYCTLGIVCVTSNRSGFWFKS